jgi:DNA-binding CsgD family transcriptional regulator
MTRLSKRALTDLRQLKAELATIVEGQPTALTWLMPTLRELIGAEICLACCYARCDGGFYVPDAYALGMKKDFVEVCNRWIAGKGRDFTTYNPVKPERAQRNVVLDLPQIERVVGRRFEAMDVFALYRELDMQHHSQMRALLCERSVLMMYVSLAQLEPFRPEQRALFARLLPSIVKRLSAERALDVVDAQTALVAAAMSHIPAPAFLLNGQGVVLETNPSGRVWLDRQLPRIAELSACVQHGTSPQWHVTRVAERGQTWRYLVIRKGDSLVAHSARLAAQHWGFSARETEILQLLSEGLTNRALAAQLNVTERTIETHLTAMFDKAQVETRTELVARALRCSATVC